MKKYFIITAVVCLQAWNASAQPEITYNNNAPQIGDVFNVSGLMGSFDPGPAGGNQNWDFSDVTPTDSYELTVISPESTPFANEFPEAGMVFHGNSSPESFIYLQLSNSEMLHNGNGIDPGPNEFFIHYTDPVKLMQFPFAFNNTYADDYFTAYAIMEGMITHEWGTITVTADAWGSVITPAGTYNNTLRIKKELVHTDSVWVMGNFISATITTQTDYEWYTATAHYPVLAISVFEDGASLIYTSLTTGIEDRSPLSQFNIYPNPASDIIHIDLPEGQPADMDVYIYDLTGKQVIKMERTGNDRFTGDISTLAPGVYLIRMQNGAVKKFVKQ